jgi:hypothetical protein
LRYVVESLTKSLTQFVPLLVNIGEPMDDLIARLECANKGGRVLDRDVALALGWTSEPDEDSTPRSLRDEGKFWHYWTTPEGYGAGWEVPAFTTSLDSALTLVPEGYRLYNLSDQFDDRRGKWFAGVANDIPPIVNPPATSYMAHAPTPALALCIAALKARLPVTQA